MAKEFGTIPIGGVIAYGGDVAPPGWLLCWGQQLKIGDYWELFKSINNNFSNLAEMDVSRSQSSTLDSIQQSYFCLPDLRGRIPFGAGIGLSYPKKVIDENSSNNGDPLMERFFGNYLNYRTEIVLEFKHLPDHTHNATSIEDGVIASKVQGEVNSIPVGYILGKAHSSGGELATETAGTLGGEIFNYAPATTCINFIIRAI